VGYGEPWAPVGEVDDDDEFVRRPSAVGPVCAADVAGRSGAAVMVATMTRVFTRIQFAFMRRVPQQARSRAMVERIIEAARIVLVRDGYESFTTNRVADEAEVSPGSLYQYFPDKSALVTEVMNRWSAEISDRVAASLAASGPVDVKDPATIRAIADALLTALETDAG